MRATIKPRPGGIGHRAAAHAREHKVGHHVELRQSTGVAADQGQAEGEQPRGDAARIHQVGDEDEQRHGDQQIRVVQPVHRLIDNQAHILMRREQVGEPAGEHGEANGGA